MAPTRPSCSADMSSLDIQTRTYVSNGMTFRATHLSKQSRSSKSMSDFFFPAFKKEENICPVSMYLESLWRENLTIQK